MQKNTIISNFKENSIVPRCTIKSQIIRYKLIEYICSECKLQNNWNNRELVLHLDHINGIRDDHRLENLRFLCPNCHSQTSTYCGKNKGQELKYCSCGNKKHYSSLRCTSCNNKYRLEQSLKKIKWPEISYLIMRTEEIGYSALGRELGVTDNAVRKHIKKRL